MSLCIDTRDNVVDNEGGKAHRTGWVIVCVVKDFKSKEVIGTLGFDGTKLSAWVKLIKITIKSFA